LTFKEPALDLHMEQFYDLMCICKAATLDFSMKIMTVEKAQEMGEQQVELSEYIAEEPSVDAESEDLDAFKKSEEERHKDVKQQKESIKTAIENSSNVKPSEFIKDFGKFITGTPKVPLCLIDNEEPLRINKWKDIDYLERVDIVCEYMAFFGIHTGALEIV